MPWAAPSPCAHPGCAVLCHTARCEAHTKQRRREADAKRPSAAKRLYDRRWRKARLAYLQAHPLCEICQAKGITEPSEVVHHKIPHRGDLTLFWDQTNWQALSKVCHDKETAKEAGTFGRGNPN